MVDDLIITIFKDRLLSAKMIQFLNYAQIMLSW